MSKENDPKIILVDAYEGNISSLGLAYIAGYLREKFRITRIKILQKKFYPDLVTAILKEQPDIVGYFSITPGFNHLLTIIKQVRKKYSGIQMMGGPHLTAMPDTLPKEIDVGVVGEGEETVGELVNLYKQSGGLPIVDLSKVKGVVFWCDGSLVKNPSRDGIMNLDDIPKPARDLLNIRGYYPNIIRAFPTKFFRSSGLMTSRGCPYTCIFCQEDALSRFRAHSAERAVEEIEELVNKYRVNFIQIMDDQFLINIKRLKKIVELVREKKIHKKTSFYCYLRANQIAPETIQLLKQMNTKLIFIGFESGSDRILKYLKDQTCSVQNNQMAYDLCRKNGIHVYGAFIVGSPQETMDDVRQTYEFIKKNHMSLCEVFILTPLPGTQIWDYARQKGIINVDADWDKMLIKMSDASQEKIWLAEKMSKQEYFEFYNTKIRPLLWHYLQVANNFSVFDLFQPKLWGLIIKKPKFYLSVLKQSIIHIFKCR